MEIKPGDRVLADTTPYGLPGAHWCEVVETTTQPASTWQLRVRIPRTGTTSVGQYRREELMDHHPKRANHPPHIRTR